ncbi:phosphoribosyltransferase [Acetohalobium arabaticum DSM 5501]|uniref:Phosphoribosyltransferase n=1 Tax=Acetohalobium arabaticum (strain ATCC 49924 / DSM 5501 / Z-7288) TaxID=574087 RepID=D9QTM9_ACEAZ|nr:phosphoribosyltransferase [Acetohalobium arabaticum DSM 5501]
MLDLVYPEPAKCLYCDEDNLVSDQIQLCRDCLERIDYITDNYCSKCGKLLDEGPECSTCQEHKYYFDQARAAALYSGGLVDYIHQFKYQGEQILAKPLGRLLAVCGSNFYKQEEIDVIVPVPLAVEKFKSRGFNQAYLLALEVGKYFGLSVDNRVLQRAVDTVSQSKLSPEERRKNVSNIFYCEPDKLGVVEDKEILLIDDIYTTGATVNECAKVLLRAGAESVSALTLATGRQRGDN